MKNTREAAEFLKKAVRALRGKASVLKARLLFLASLHRRTAVVGAISHRIRALVSSQAAATAAAAAAAQRRRRALASAEGVDEQLAAPPDVSGLSELASLFQEVDDGDGYPDWTHSLFDDDAVDGDVGEVADEGLAADEPSVMDVIRSRREGDGVEFNVDEEIDNAADMFIRRVRSRMNHRSF